MKLKDLFESSNIQDHVDTWVETGDGSAELDKWIEEAPPLQHNLIVYRVEHGNRGVKALKELHQGSTWELGRSTSMSERGIIDGVLEPGGQGPDEACVFVIHLPAGKSWGRKIKHSDHDHPENVQDEFMLRKGVKVRVTDVIEPDSTDDDDDDWEVNIDKFKHFVVKPI